MPDPNNIVSRKHKLCFMLIPKCANTSIKLAIMSALGKDPRVNPHAAFDTMRTEDIPADFLTVTVLRNPVSRIQSVWKDKVRDKVHRGFRVHPEITEGMSLRAFVEAVSRIPDEDAEQHFRSQFWHLYDGSRYVPDVTARVETLKKDWKRIRRAVKIHSGLVLPSSLPRANTSEGELLWDSYLSSLVNERYATDFDMYLRFVT